MAEKKLQQISRAHPDHDKWISGTTPWRVLRLRIEERPPIWKVAADILNK
jgi:hypothetical protein